ncbi:hypothetical protein Y032_0698g1617 [Ancylostoma ceylanicum]|uniref:Secreted protein n=1 Tax=Ancylostoma ceylanicum TaxID=53326 RepID=A0A016WGI3_9BILA|nr:hypothetical protein Y032_0698g1617 [Ancylostoma ceylanicum]
MLNPKLVDLLISSVLAGEMSAQSWSTTHIVVGRWACKLLVSFQPTACRQKKAKTSCQHASNRTSFRCDQTNC